MLRCWFEVFEFHHFTLLQLFLPKNLLLLFDVNGEYIDYDNKDFNIIVCYGQSDYSRQQQTVILIDFFKL